jgi:hypothetical protein
MIYRVGVEDIEPNHWVAWSFDRPGLTGKGKTHDAALEHLQTLLPDGEIRVTEEFRAYPSPQDPEPDYIVNAFFEDDRRLLTKAEINTVLDELTINRRNFLAQLADVPQDILTRSISGEVFGSIMGIIRHVAGAEWWYCQHLGGIAQWALLTGDPLTALAVARADTRVFLPTLVGDTRIVTHVNETWSARKVLRRTLWHERDHIGHIAERLRELSQ